MGDTSIEWTEKVWNPTRGCDIYSKECTNCYAMRQAHRFSNEKGGRYAGLTKLTKAGPVWNGVVRHVPAQLGAPLQWKTGCRVFVDSMSDLFYGDETDEARAVARGQPFIPVTFDYIMACFEVMLACERHTFQILTKRPARMLAFLSEQSLAPMPHIQIGCSVGYQGAADARRPSMQAIARVGWRTWVSYEPALEDVDWEGWHFIRWLVAGAESGHGRRPAELDWFRRARTWCAKHSIAYFMKQLVGPGKSSHGNKIPFLEFPPDLRVRQYP